MFYKSKIMVLYHYKTIILPLTKECNIMMAEKIRLVLAKRNKSKAWLAEQLNWSASNLYNKFKRDNFSERELIEIAKVLNCTFEANFSLNDSDEKF